MKSKLLLSGALSILLVVSHIAFSKNSYPPELQQKLNSALQEKPADYKPRTQHFCNNKPCFTNRLILEDSTYLQQHAHNPVDWFPWSIETLNKAKQENKIIFLSIGYSTCHWCHVMEKESFDDREVADVLNKHFISIKVDREMRPDIDELFSYVALITGGVRGWPTTLFLTPDGKPFFGSSYYPKDDFISLISSVQTSWAVESDKISNRAEQIAKELQRTIQINADTRDLDKEMGHKAIKQMLSIYDPDYGGFGQGSKFPNETWLMLMLTNVDTFKDKKILSTALKTTLNKMSAGGIHDHVRGGFHRYVTDPFWNVPHFEKMLYTQAMLARVYLTAYHMFQNKDYLRAATRTLDFVLSDLSSSEGVFYTAVDADSSVDGDEGSFYTWQYKELKKILNDSELKLFSAYYSVYNEGDRGDANILYADQGIDEFSVEYGVTPNNVLARLDKILAKLRNERKKHTYPLIDKKIIMGWNGLMISALTEGYKTTSDQRYLVSAVKAAEFVWANMIENDVYYRIYVNGKISGAAQLNDYVYYLEALIRLYDIQDNNIWLRRAEMLTQSMIKKLWDNKAGGFFFSENDGSPVLIKIKPGIDKTLPSGNAIAAQSLLKLATRTENPQYVIMAKRIFSLFASDIQQYPSAYSSLLIAEKTLFDGDNRLPTYIANGNIKIQGYYQQLHDNDYEAVVVLDLNNQWHVNSNEPLNKDLIPTRIELVSKSERLAFTGNSLS